MLSLYYDRELDLREIGEIVEVTESRGVPDPRPDRAAVARDLTDGSTMSEAKSQLRACPDHNADLPPWRMSDALLHRFLRCPRLSAETSARVVTSGRRSSLRRGARRQTMTTSPPLIIHPNT